MWFKVTYCMACNNSPSMFFPVPLCFIIRKKKKREKLGYSDLEIALQEPTFSKEKNYSAQLIPVRGLLTSAIIILVYHHVMVSWFSSPDQQKFSSGEADVATWISLMRAQSHHSSLWGLGKRTIWTGAKSEDKPLSFAATQAHSPGETSPTGPLQESFGTTG